MTFRTIDENATNNINKYGIRNSSFADIANAYNAGGIKGVGNSLSSFITSKDLSNIKEFNRLVSEEGVSSQTAWYKTMQTSSNAAKELFDNEENLVKSGNSVILSEKAISTATNTMTFSAKAGQVALKGLALAGNMVVGILAGFVISKAIEGLDNLVHAADNAKESAESFSNSFSSMNDEFNSNNSKLSDLQKKYDELSKGVNSLGENVSLTTDEYDEYKQVVSEISDMMPSLLARYDDEGNKIGFVQGKLSDLNAEYDKYKKNKAMDLVNGENDNGDSIKDVFNNYQYQTAHIDANGNAVGKRKLIGSSNYEKIGQLQAEINSGYDGVFGQNKLTNADIEKKTALIQKYQSEIDASVSAIQDALSAIAQSGDEYYKLSDQEQQFLDTYINSLSQDFIDENNLTNETNARTFINNLINDIESSKPEIMKAYNDLFSFNIDDTDLSPEEVQKKVNELIQQLAKALGENNWKDLKIRLGFEFVDDNVKNYKNTLKRFKDSDKIKDFFNTEGINTQKEIDAFNDVTKGINDADEAIQEYEQSIQQAQTDTEELGNTLANINKTKSGIGGLFDKYEQNEGYLTQDEVASVLETNPEYIQYLVKVGDQYKLNEQALNDWNEVNKEQKQEINNQMGGNDYLSNYSPLLDSIQDNASHPNGGVGNTNIGSQLDDLINKNKEWNTSLQNGEITTAQYFQNISNAITNSGLEDALHSLNGKFDDSTDYIEETVSVLATQLSDGLAQSTKRFEEGQTSVQDYIEEINAGSDAEKKLLASTYDLNISQETGKASLDGLSGAALEAAQNYNSLVDSQNALASTSGFVDVLSQNAEFLSQYTDEAGNLMDSIFDDSRFNDYISNMSNSIVDFANQNTTTMGDVANWLAETAGISTDQATSIIAQGGEAVQEAVGGSLNGVQSMTSFAMSQVGTAAGNAASAVGSVLSSLGQMISSFSYKITAKPFIQGKSKFDWNPKTGFDVSLPTFGFDIKGSGGKSVKSFSTSLGKAGEALNKYGASQNASAAFNNINSYKPKRKLSANKPSSYRPTYKPKSSGKSGGGSKSPSSGSGSGSEKEPTKKDYDWIETLISRINRQVSNLGKTVSATYKTWSTRNNALAQELGTVNQQISAEQQAYNKYMQLANSVGLPEGYASLVRNGTIDVSTIQDDDLNDKIEKYQNYYNKALEASDAVQDLQDKLAELAKTKFDNVNSEYEAQLKQIDHSINVYDKMIDTAETQGYIASQKYYNALISTESSNISELQLQYSSLTSARNEAIKAGNIAKYSEEWYSMTDSINSVEEAIQDANKSLIEYKNNLRQVNWDFFDKQEDYISKLQDESDWLIDLITTENKLFNSDNGKITSSGKAVEGLHAINYNAYMTQADDYAKEIKKIDAEIANDPANTTLIERRQELLEQQRDMIKSAEDEKSAIKDLVSDGYDALSKALKKIADNYLDALNAQKDLYDYAKTIREQTKAVAQYEKQLEAIKNDTSEETKAQIQQIKVKLEDAKQDLADSEYNQWISDQQNIVDTFESELEDWINSRLDDLDELVQNVIDQTNTSASEINDVIEKEAGDVGYTVSDAISKVMDVDSTNGTNMVNFYDKTFPNEMTTTRNSIDAIKNLLQAMKDAADKKAQEEIKKQQAAQQAISNPASSSSSSSSSSSNSHSSNNSGSSSSSSGWGSWFVHKADSYPKSKLRINSSIVDRLKLHNFDSSKSARAGYYKAMGGSGTYVGSASQNNWMISEMKKHGFKQGGTIGKLIRSTGEDGFVLARTGEEILSKEKLIMLKDALQYIPQNFNIASTSLPKFTQKASNSSVDVKVDFGGITMNGVNNPEEFVTELQKSKRFEKIVQSITVDTAMGKNSLGKYKF